MHPALRHFYYSSTRGGFLPTAGVFGDGSNDYLQARNVSDSSEYVYTTPDEWTFEIFMKSPTALAANESIFSTNSLNVGTNLININYGAIASSSPARYGIRVTSADAAGAALYTNVLIARMAQTTATRKNIHIIIRCTLNGSNYDFYAFVNGVKITLATNKTTKPSSIGFNYLMDRTQAGRYSDASIYATRLYGRGLSDAECRASYNNGNYSSPVGASLVFNQLLDERTGNDFADAHSADIKLTAVNFANITANLTTPEKSTTFKRLVGGGNSIMAGFGTTGFGGSFTHDPITLTYGLFNDDLFENFYNSAVTGRTTPQCITDFTATDQYRFDSSNVINYYVAWEITNHLYAGATAQEAYDSYVEWCELAKAKGFKVVAMTVLPRSSGTPPASFETDRQAINTLIRNNYTSFADALADVGGDATIGEDGDETNVTYYSDLVHLTDAGQAIVAELIHDAILTIS